MENNNQNCSVSNSINPKTTSHTTKQWPNQLQKPVKTHHSPLQLDALCGQWPLWSHFNTSATRTAWDKSTETTKTTFLPYLLTCIAPQSEPIHQHSHCIDETKVSIHTWGQLCIVCHPKGITYHLWWHDHPQTMLYNTLGYYNIICTWPYRFANIYYIRLGFPDPLGESTKTTNTLKHISPYPSFA